MKTKIILHGKIAKKYGAEFEFFNIKKGLDAIKALETRFPGFKNDLMNEAKNGGHYEMIVNDESRDAYAINTKEKIETIDIVPCILGKDPITLIVLGVALATYAVVGGLGVVAATFLFTLAVGLIIAGIMYLLTPIPENEPNMDINASVKNSSFIFTNPQNISTQGRAIPVGYGRLKIGSYVVGTSITTRDLSDDRQNAAYLNSRSDILVKIQETFGSATRNFFRGY
jgi:predicted phage tail protein